MRPSVHVPLHMHFYNGPTQHSSQQTVLYCRSSASAWFNTSAQRGERLQPLVAHVARDSICGKLHM